MGGRKRSEEHEAAPKLKESVLQALPGEDAEDFDLVVAAVQRINALYTGRALEMAREIGAYIIGTFFDGDAENFRNRGGSHKTFTALANHEALQLSRVSLWRAVSVYDQLKLLPENIADALPYTHHTLLLPLHDEGTKVEVAKAAVAKGWSKVEMKAEVARVREKEKKSKGGRKALLPFVRVVNQFERLLKEEDAFEGLDETETLDETEVKRIQKVIARMRRKLDELSAALKGPVPDPE